MKRHGKQWHVKVVHFDRRSNECSSPKGHNCAGKVRDVCSRGVIVLGGERRFFSSNRFDAAKGKRIFEERSLHLKGRMCQGVNT
jgi:hypothetical protein